MKTITALPEVDLRHPPGQLQDHLRAAAHEVGFFYLTGPGVSAATRRVMAAARRLFALPQAEKDAIAMVRSPHFRGYTRLGGELTGGHVDWREPIDIGPERDAVGAPASPTICGCKAPISGRPDCPSGSRGLQVRPSRGDDSWNDVPVLDWALVVNIGELLELATGGYLRATEHRVKLHHSAERISVPYFFNPRLDAQIPTLSLPPGLAARATPRADPSDPIFSVYGRNAWKSRLRAHPDVAGAYGYSSGE